MKTLTLILFAGLAMAQAPQPSPIFGAGGSVTPGNITLNANSYPCNPTSGSAAAVNCPLQEVNILNAGANPLPGGTISFSGTIGAGSTSASVLSCPATFVAPYYLGIAGASSVSPNYFTSKIVGCFGGLLTWTDATTQNSTNPTIRADDTHAFQAVITAASTTPTLLIVPNVGACYNISSQLTLNSGGVSNAAAFAIHGDLIGTGMSGSCFRAQAAMANILDLVSWHGGYMEHVGFDGNNIVTHGAVLVDSNNPNNGDATYQDKIDDITILGLANTEAAIQYGDYLSACSPTPQISEQLLTNSKFYGDQSTTLYGVLVNCGGNVKNYKIGRSTIDGFVTAGVRFSGQNTSSLVLDHDIFLNNALDWTMPVGGSLLIDGGETEGSTAFGNAGAGGVTVPCNVVVNGYSWQGVAASSDIILTQSGYCIVTLTGNQFRNDRTAGTIPKLSIAGILQSFGNHYWNATNAAYPWGATVVTTIGDAGPASGTIVTFTDNIGASGSNIGGGTVGPISAVQSNAVAFGSSSTNKFSISDGGSNNFNIGAASLANLGINGTAVILKNASGGQMLAIGATGTSLGKNVVGATHTVDMKDSTASTGATRVEIELGAADSATTPILAVDGSQTVVGNSLVTGINDGTAPMTVTTGTSGSLGGTYKSGYTINEEATAAQAVTYTLPTAAAGLQYCVGNGYNGSNSNTGALTIATSASGQFIIFTDGTLSATGGNVASGGAAADFACVVGVDSTHWLFRPTSGTWTKN